jgi:hypothetical protein
MRRKLPDSEVAPRPVPAAARPVGQRVRTSDAGRSGSPQERSPGIEVAGLRPTGSALPRHAGNSMNAYDDVEGVWELRACVMHVCDRMASPTSVQTCIHRGVVPPAPETPARFRRAGVSM